MKLLFAGLFLISSTLILYNYLYGQQSSPMTPSTAVPTTSTPTTVSMPSVSTSKSTTITTKSVATIKPMTSSTAVPTTSTPTTVSIPITTKSPATIKPTTKTSTTPGSSCSSDEDCGLNETCQVHNNHTYSCVCSLGYHRNNMTQECILQYQWKNYTTDLWNDTRLVRVNTSDASWVVVRVREESNNGKYATKGKINYVNGELTPAIALHGLDKEVLLVEHNKTEWIPSSNGTILNNTIVSDSDSHGERIYVCRFKRKNQTLIGEILNKKSECHTYDDPSSKGADYKLLVLKM